MIWMTEKLHRQNLQPLGAYDILLPPMSYVLHSRAFGQLLHSKLSFTVRNLAGNGALNFYYFGEFFVEVYFKQNIETLFHL